MKVGIDASNLREGGGITHLVELLRVADPLTHGFRDIIVWGGTKILSTIESRKWLHKKHCSVLDRSLLYRIFWQQTKLKQLAEQAQCDVLFSPGGTGIVGFKPTVTMSRNMLPFDWRELCRYGLSFMTLKFVLLRFAQKRTFQEADGLIFLTQYAKSAVMDSVKRCKGIIAIIPHGVSHRFFYSPSKRGAKSEFNRENPIKLVYVSMINVYKHQWAVVEAVAKLRNRGVPLVLDLIGPAYAPALRRLDKTMEQVAADRHFIRYRGDIPHQELHQFLVQADIGVFASSCENMPNILLENMASGLPIACSNRGPMPEILGDAGVYFDPENPEEIAAVISMLIASPALRAERAEKAFLRAKRFSWDRCADETFGFLADVVCDYQSLRGAKPTSRRN